MFSRPRCIQFHSITSYSYLDLIPSDMSAPRAEWSTYLLCYPLGSGPGDYSSTIAALVHHFRLENNLLASYINIMTHHVRLWQLSLFRVLLICFLLFCSSKWSELTHYFLPRRTDRKQPSQVNVHMPKHIRHVHIWPCFSSTAYTAVILALWVIIWVISKDTSAVSSWWGPLEHSWF